VLPFLAESRRRQPGDRHTGAQDGCDHGPSPEESLRVMRAFVGIKNRKVRENLIDILEGASQPRAQISRPAEE
jgi:hypothetical protein